MKLVHKFRTYARTFFFFFLVFDKSNKVRSFKRVNFWLVSNNSLYSKIYNSTNFLLVCQHDRNNSHWIIWKSSRFSPLIKSFKDSIGIKALINSSRCHFRFVRAERSKVGRLARSRSSKTIDASRLCDRDDLRNLDLGRVARVLSFARVYK